MQTTQTTQTAQAAQTTQPTQTTRKISDIMRQREALSFEIFPPKTEKGFQNLDKALDELCAYSPDYISVTYGAGGGNAGLNRRAVQMVADHGVLPVTHFTVIGRTRDEMRTELQGYLDAGVDHVLALRGDFPRGMDSTGSDFRYATDLVEFIREEFNGAFEIAVAGSPEGHIACSSLEADVEVLRQKQELGADYVMTQLCWDMDAFARWLDMLDRTGVTIPIDAGVMPVLDIASTINMSLSRNGCTMDRELCRLISKYWVFPNPFADNSDDAEAERKKADFRAAGIEYTVRQVEKYRALGVGGIHLYALNRSEAVSQIVEATGLRGVSEA